MAAKPADEGIVMSSIFQYWQARFVARFVTVAYACGSGSNFMAVPCIH